MSNINLSGAKAKGSNLSATDCTGTNLEAADLRRASLAGAQLRDANLAIAKLRHANLSQCDLRGAIMRGADLAGAQLTGSLLTDADLTDAVLLDTDLAKADLKKAIGLNQAQIATARGDSKTRLPRGLKLTLLPDPGPGGKLTTDLEGRDDKADEAAIFAGIQGTVGCPAVGAGCDA